MTIMCVVMFICLTCVLGLKVQECHLAVMVMLLLILIYIVTVSAGGMIIIIFECVCESKSHLNAFKVLLET